MYLYLETISQPKLAADLYNGRLALVSKEPVVVASGTVTTTRPQLGITTARLAMSMPRLKTQMSRLTTSFFGY